MEDSSEHPIEAESTTNHLANEEETEEDGSLKRKLEADSSEPTDPTREEDIKQELDEPVAKHLHLDLPDYDSLEQTDEEEDEEEDDDENESQSYSSSDIDEAEIDRMLEEGIKAQPSLTNLIQEKKPKVLLKGTYLLNDVLGRDHFELLPEGWVEIPHNSGMPVYLHKASRVCTMSKPYYLGPASTRKHEIPVSAVPCLNYRRELDKLKKKDETGKEKENEPSQNLPKIPSAKIESLQESKKENSLVHVVQAMIIMQFDFAHTNVPDPHCQAVHDYCSKLFEFETITVRRFASWAGRRKHHNVMKQIHRPTLPEGTKLITIPIQVPQDKVSGSSSVRKEFVMNPAGKSYVCILHEYVQHALRMQPRFAFKELENSATPFMSTVIINDTKYGSGYGSSKKQAKSEAARVTIETLIPEMKDINLDPKKPPNPRLNHEIDFFDQIQVEDVRVAELCTRTGQPTPYQILLECLKRNHGMGNTDVKYEMTNLNYQKNEFVMTVGKHTAKVICKNKRDGKQRASQAILKAIHPYITCWGSLLQLYGKGSCKTVREKKDMEHSITFLQRKAKHNQPNYAILAKLKEEMLKIKEKKVHHWVGLFHLFTSAN
ncbi:DGCR8 [Cordylochernes scorpioides]|uniref:DGCR8 n=1 Tax=Cordylochernes scorpioides TaxID=51811 RepID=A0ABY6LPA3_9ARAC|nr:DGCR8 [Cordylochernes scorpioides]